MYQKIQLILWLVSYRLWSRKADILSSNILFASHVTELKMSNNCCWDLDIAAVIMVIISHSLQHFFFSSPTFSSLPVQLQKRWCRLCYRHCIKSEELGETGKLKYFVQKQLSFLKCLFIPAILSLDHKPNTVWNWQCYANRTLNFISIL